MEFQVSYYDLFQVLRDNDKSPVKDRRKLLVNFIFDNFDVKASEFFKRQIEEKLRTSFLNNFNKRLLEVQKKKKSYKFFEEKHSEWLKRYVSFFLKENQDPLFYEPGKC